jgi:hypothetical protein
LEGNPRNDKNGTNAKQWQGVARKVQPATVLGTSIASPARKLLELSDPQPVTNDTTSEFCNLVLIEIRATDNLEKAQLANCNAPRAANSLCFSKIASFCG